MWASTEKEMWEAATVHSIQEDLVHLITFLGEVLSFSAFSAFSFSFSFLIFGLKDDEDDGGDEMA